MLHTSPGKGEMVDSLEVLREDSRIHFFFHMVQHLTADKTAELSVSIWGGRRDEGVIGN